MKKDMLIDYFNKNNYHLDVILNDNTTTILYDILYNDAQMYTDQNNAELMHCFGVISKIRCNYIDAEHYYLIAIENKFAQSMNNLALMYQIKNKYVEAEHYYLLAIKNNHINAITNLAYMYYCEKKYVDAEHYYLMAIENNNIDAMNNIASIYYFQEKYEKSEHYYLMAIENNHNEAITNLVFLYNKLNNHKKLLCLQKKYNNDDLDSTASRLVKDILTNQITVSNDVLLEIRYFNYENNYAIEFFTFSDIIKINILKKIGVVPQFTLQEYQTYKFMLNNIIPYRKFFRYAIHYNILMYICRKIFNDVILSIYNVN